jgi:hypothetical protein
MEGIEIRAGIHKDITNEQYHACEAIGRSDLKSIAKVPAGYLYQNSGDGLAFGAAAHLYMLEPHLFNNMVIESSAKTTNANDYKKLVEQYPGKHVLTAGSIELIELLAKAIFEHPFAAELLGSSDKIAEPTIFWRDEDEDVWCKARPDLMIPSRRCFADLKFLKEGFSDPKKFLWSVRDYGYDIQAAWNIMGGKKATGVTYPEFWFICVEKAEPYRVGVYQLDDEWLGDTMFDAKNLLKRFVACRAAGDWPNYTEENKAGETLYRFVS